MKTIRAYFFAASVAIVFLGVGLDSFRHRSIEAYVEVVAHSRGSAGKEHDELIALGEAGRETYARLLWSGDQDVRRLSAVLLCELGKTSKDPAVGRYLAGADDRDVAAMTLLRSICDERSAGGDRLICMVLKRNRQLSPLIVQFLMSTTRDGDRRFRAFVASQTSAKVLRSMQSGLACLHSCKRHEDLLAAIAVRLGQLDAGPYRVAFRAAD